MHGIALHKGLSVKSQSGIFSCKASTPRLVWVISREVGLRFEKPWAEHFSLRFCQCVLELVWGVHLVPPIIWVRKFGSPVVACFLTFAVIPLVCRLHANNESHFFCVFLPASQSCQINPKVPTSAFVGLQLSYFRLFFGFFIIRCFFCLCCWHFASDFTLLKGKK